MTELIFTSEYSNLLLLVNGLIFLFYFGAKKKNKQKALKFGNYSTLQKIAGDNFLKSSNIVLLVRMLAVTALIIGISQPVLLQEAPSSESDYVLAIDSSASMLATDLEPSRLEAAKEISSDFVEKLSEDTNVGAVSFSGEVKKEIDLSENNENVTSRIMEIETGQKAGTAIGNALITSTSMLIDSNSSKTIVLITDGRNNVGSSLNESLSFADENNLTIHSIGIGSQRNDTEEYGIIQGQNGSRTDFPNLDQEKLYRLSNSTGGESLTVTDSSQLEKALIEVEQKEVEKDISEYLIFLAAFLLLVEWVIGTTRYSVIP